MFETLPIPALDVLLITARGVLLIGAVWVFALAFIRWRRADESASQRLQMSLERAFNEIRSLNETVSVMSAKLDSLSERSDAGARVALPPATSTHRGYDIATRLARNGAAAEELVASCGITRHEADLLLRLHGNRQRDQVPPPVRHQPAQCVEERAMLTQPAPAVPTGQAAGARKRGSLLSVVG